MLKHAFMIAVHKNFDQINFLCETLSFGDIFIHVDLKSEILYEQLKEKYEQIENIYIIKDRVNVNWSGFSQVEATLRLMKAIYYRHKHYDYIHFISGQDILLYTQESLDKLFINNGLYNEYIEVEDINSYFWRLQCYSFFRENPKNRTIVYRILDNLIRLPQLLFVRRKNFKGYALYKGGQWFSITQDFLEFVLHIVETTDYVKRFKYTACPDEHFFQILAMNSDFKKNVTKNNLRYVHFSRYNASPDTLTYSDKDAFMNGQYIFARKFEDLEEEKKVIENRL